MYNRMRILPEGSDGKVLVAVAGCFGEISWVQYVIPWPDF